MYNLSEVYTLSSGSFPDRFQQADRFDGPVYQAQLMFTGPDAAIELAGDEIKLFMNGVPSDNPHFRELIDSYEESIAENAEELRSAPDDRVVFTGVWYHLDYAQVPRFEPYVIHVISADGEVSSCRYDLKLFDYDSPGEGLMGMLALETTIPSAIHQVLKSEAAELARIKTISHMPCGLRPLQGVIWFPAEEDEDDLPIVVSKLFTVTNSDQQADYDIEVFPEDVLTPSQCEFKAALAHATDIGEITPRLAAAFQAVADKDEGSDAARGWVLRELSLSKFGVYRGEVVWRGPRPGPITMSDLANSSTARGAWFQVRFGDNVYDPMFRTFDDKDRIGGNDDRGVLTERSETGCLLISEWCQSRSKHATRFIALGPEPRLSW